MIMKKSLFVFCLFVLAYQIGFSQIYNMRQDLVKLPFKVDIDSNQLRVLTDLQGLEHDGLYTDLLQIRDLGIEDGDLILNYSLEGPDKFFYYIMDFSLTDESGREVAYSQYRLEAQDTIQDIDKGRSLEVDWLDISETGLYFNKNYNLNVKYQLYGTQECGVDNRPYWGFRRWWPHLAAGVVGGGGLLLAGESFRQRAEDDEANYQDLWKSGEPEVAGLQVSDSYDQNKDNARNFTIAGAVFIGIDLIWLGIRYQNHLRKVKLYNRYCTPKVSISPDVSFLNGQQELYGLKLNYRISH